MLQTGKTEKELMELVAKIDELTEIDSTIARGQSVVIQATMCGVAEKDEDGEVVRDGDGHPIKKCELKDWTLQVKSTSINSKLHFETPFNDTKRRGRPKKSDTPSRKEFKSYNALVRTLNSIRQMDAPLNEEIVVLCLASSKEYKQYNGKIITNWIVINPTIPFEMVNGMPEFPTLTLELSDEEYHLAMESRMALYNEFTQDVYPIREVAFSSIGKLLDSAASFKNMATIPLGSALLLADRLAEPQKELKLIYRNAKGKVKPLIGIAGSRFAEDSQYDFFRDGLDYIANTFGPYEIRDWEITDDVSTVNVYLKCYEREHAQVYLRLQTSDIPGTSASVTAFLETEEWTDKRKVGRRITASALIQKNSAYHWDSFKEKGGVQGLFVRYEKDDKKRKNPIAIKTEIEAFLAKYDATMDLKIVYDGKKLLDKQDEIVRLIGKKRAKSIEETLVRGNIYKANILYHGLLRTTMCTLPTKQANELTKLYADLLIIISESENRGESQKVV